MATLEQIGELVSEQLHERVDRLVSAVEEDAPDLADIALLADAVGEFADTIAEIYNDLEQTLMGGLSRVSDSKRQAEDPRTEQHSQQERRRQQSNPNGATSEEERTKEELLEQARELNVHGRSAMAKDELVQAVEAEESVTKDELLDRAREAGIEGRSSMTKEELRDALHEAGA
jgi:hypothetical protein